jgi:hypothetical protein
VRLAEQVVLAQIGREKQEAEVVDVAVELSRFERTAQLAGGGQPLVVLGVAVEQPEDAGEKTFAPVRPTFALAIPLAADGVHRRVVGVRRENAIRLGGGEIEAAAKGG